MRMQVAAIAYLAHNSVDVVQLLMFQAATNGTLVLTRFQRELYSSNTKSSQTIPTLKNMQTEQNSER